MRLLLDEDLPTRLRLDFSEEVTVETVEHRGWKGMTNGALLRAAEAKAGQALRIHPTSGAT